ncbi:GNAT family N-acetyltransferase [Hymenobacter sp. DH14]|uniref:GNAT family N-acetyltransferase n=1 Tax=Hymenobacter cyanobacteriorum TaxID=2926463 RepID=A0A9X1VDX2_9BACT|nr:GNAT family N-acetyltransferase [Hymenobacter cyanobacteriorum]MCI1187394.1 GNAT family N-acetyltransferase [Hymenobacter cyanobacteriorum]
MVAEATAGAGTALGVWLAPHGPAGPPLPRLPLAFEPFLYLRPTHLALAPQPGPGFSAYLEDAAAGRTLAQLHVHYNPVTGLARSPAQAPFGAVQLAPGLGRGGLHQLLDAAEAELRRLGIEQLAMRGYPFAYDPAGAATLAEALRQRGYRVALAEQNYHLDPARDYEAHLHPSERRRLHKCRRAGLFIEQEPAYLLPLAYEFIQQCRQERGQTLSLPLERVQELFRAFPREHFLFSVREPGGAWAALTVAIQVSSTVLYNFYPASPLRCNNLSPVVLLNEGLHAFARASGLTVLDLGTSTLDSGPNTSLLRFKRHLGAVAGLRLSWEKAF